MSGSKDDRENHGSMCCTLQLAAFRFHQTSCSSRYVNFDCLFVHCFSLHLVRSEAVLARPSQSLLTLDSIRSMSARIKELEQECESWRGLVRCVSMRVRVIVRLTVSVLVSCDCVGHQGESGKLSSVQWGITSATSTSIDSLQNALTDTFGPPPTTPRARTPRYVA